jgi:AcrR family transcriptional regulator
MYRFETGVNMISKLPKQKSKRHSKRPTTKHTPNKRPNKKRAYNNDSRNLKVGQAQQHIIQCLVDLLVEQQGGDVQIGEIARRSGFSRRTIFRFFKDKANLTATTSEYLQSYLESSLTKIELHDVPGFAREIYAKFDEFESKVLAYLYSPFGRQARILLRSQLNQIVINHIVRSKKLEKTPDRERKLAVIVALINAKVWHDIRADFGFSGLEVGPAIEWALKTLIDKL